MWIILRDTIRVNGIAIFDAMNICLSACYKSNCNYWKYDENEQIHMISNIDGKLWTFFFFRLNSKFPVSKSMQTYILNNSLHNLVDYILDEFNSILNSILNMQMRFYCKYCESNENALINWKSFSDWWDEGSTFNLK